MGNRHFFKDLGKSTLTKATGKMATAFQTYIAPAKPRNQIWRMLAGLVLIAAAWIAGTIVVLWLAQPGQGADGLSRLARDLSDPNTPRAMFVLLFTFLGPVLGVILAAALLHRRSPASLIGPLRPATRDFLKVFRAALVIYAVILAISLIWSRPIPNMDLASWAVLLLPAIALIALQTGAEELLFRGYAMQQLAARFKSPWIWMGLPSIAFGLMHFDPKLGREIAALIILATGLFGLISADLTRRTGNLGAAWALHLCNNIAALLIIAMDGQMTGLALFVTPYSLEDGELLRMVLIGDILAQTITWALIVRILRR